MSSAVAPATVGSAEESAESESRVESAETPLAPGSGATKKSGKVRSKPKQLAKGGEPSKDSVEGSLEKPGLIGGTNGFQRLSELAAGDAPYGEDECEDEKAGKLGPIERAITRKRLEGLQVEMERMQPYLPNRKVKRLEPDTQKVNFIQANYCLWSGKFLTVGGKGVDDTIGLKQRTVDEHTNLAIVSALILSLVMPLFFENVNDFLQEDFAGSGADFDESELGVSWGSSYREKIRPLLADVTHFCYAISSVGFLLSSLASVYMLLCVNRFADDFSVQVFVGRMGLKMRLPYMFFTIGQVCWLGVFLRILHTAQHYAVLIIEMLVMSGMAIIFYGCSQAMCVQCMWNTLSDSESFEPLSLTPDEVREDVSIYIDNEGAQARLQDCLLALQARSHNGVVVPLSGTTTAIAKLAFYKTLAAKLELSMYETDIILKAATLG